MIDWNKAKFRQWWPMLSVFYAVVGLVGFETVNLLLTR